MRSITISLSLAASPLYNPVQRLQCSILHHQHYYIWSGNKARFDQCLPETGTDTSVKKSYCGVYITIDVVLVSMAFQKSEMTMAFSEEGLLLWYYNCRCTALLVIVLIIVGLHNHGYLPFF